MYRILVVDDEENIRKLIKKYAEFEGYEIVEADNGLEVLQMASERSFDLIILDVMLPDLDGFYVCTRLRKMVQTPIIMLTAKGEEYDRIRGFELGADDYVIKPFSPKELMMRAAAIIKRSFRGDSINREIISFDGIKVDFTGRHVYIDDDEVVMTPKEYDLFFYMVRNRGIALTREKLINNIWGYDYFGDDRTLDTHIKLLRKSLGKYSSYIATLRGVGYRFEA